MFSGGRGFSVAFKGSELPSACGVFMRTADSKLRSKGSKLSDLVPRLLSKQTARMPTAESDGGDYHG